MVFSLAFLAACSPASRELVGHSLETGAYPYFEFANTFFEGQIFEVGVDSTRFPNLREAECDLYVVEARTKTQWANDKSLQHAGSEGPWTIQTSSTPDIRDNIFALQDAGLSGSPADGRFGKGYDVVLDCNRNALLDIGDSMDRVADGSGLHMAPDPSLPGPFGVSSADYSFLGAPKGFRDARVFYPAEIAALGELPVVVISHGVTHDYRWYDHIQSHLASHGFIAVAHQNNVPDGEAPYALAAETTFEHTHGFLKKHKSIAGGALKNHVDSTRIAWLGHSRGGAGVTHAYMALASGAFSSNKFDVEDVRLVGGIAPVTPLPEDLASGGQGLPNDVPYMLLVGSADGDLCNCSDVFNESEWTFRQYERMTGEKSYVSIHGMGHEAFHNGGNPLDSEGTCLLDRSVAHPIINAYLLAGLSYHLRGDLAGKDFLWRHWETFQPDGIPEHNEPGCELVVNRAHRPAQSEIAFSLDDYQNDTCPALVNQASSGAAVEFDVEVLEEGVLSDTNREIRAASFFDVGRCDEMPCDWIVGNMVENQCNLACASYGQTCVLEIDPMNGMFNGVLDGLNEPRGVTFEWAGDERYYAFEIPAEKRNLLGHKFLSLRATQVSRHPYTKTNVVVGDDLSFSVELRDTAGASSRIEIDAYGAGIELPYQRAFVASPGGWANEWETIRIRLQDFRRHNPFINLKEIETIRFLFGGSYGTAQGRIGLDEVELID